MAEESNLGKIEISPTAIATIASQAVLSTYGVVGMASRNLVSGLTSALSRRAHKGIEVHVQDHQIIIDVYVIIEYGTRIASVAQSIKNVVKFAVEKAVGVPVTAVNVHVEGLRISDVD